MAAPRACFARRSAVTTAAAALLWLTPGCLDTAEAAGRVLGGTTEPATSASSSSLQNEERDEDVRDEKSKKASRSEEEILTHPLAGQEPASGCAEVQQSEPLTSEWEQTVSY